MLGTDARWVVAVVQDPGIWWDWAVVKLPGRPVRKGRAAFDFDTPITRSGAGPNPIPTLVSHAYSSPKARCNRFVFHDDIITQGGG